MDSLLETAFATETVAFIGYSLRDWNILKLSEDLTHHLGRFTPTSLRVSLSATLDSMHASIRPIATSGDNFLNPLKRMLQLQFLPATIYDDAAESLEKPHELDPSNQEGFLDAKQYPLLVYSSVYSDGLRDTLGRIIRFKKTGQHSDKSRAFRNLHYYSHLIDNAGGKGLFCDEFYLNDYVKGLSVLANNSDPDKGNRLENTLCFSMPLKLR